MAKLHILSRRSSESWPSYDLIHEWEDELVAHLPSTNLLCAKEITLHGHHLLVSLENKIGFNPNSLLTRGKRCFHFDISARLHPDYTNSPNHSVCIVDFYLQSNQIPTFYQAYSRVGQLFVSSREVYEFLLNHNPEREVKHMPLTLPDRWLGGLTPDLKKEFDLVLVGRQNPKLMEWLQRYGKEKELLYVFRSKDYRPNYFPYYTNNGDYVGNIANRSDYFHLMRKSRVAFYSTPGIDGDEARTNGFAQVTPRFLELLACGCNIVSRFVDNADTRYFQLDRMTLRANNYSEFVHAMEQALDSPPDFTTYANYLANHCTSVVAREALKE